MSFQKMLTLSTAHISAKAAEELTLGMAMAAVEDPNERDYDVPEWVNLLIVYSHGECGWLINVMDNDDHTVRAHLPHEFLAMIDWAYENRCDWILLDPDAEQIEQLPTFEW